MDGSDIGDKHWANWTAAFDPSQIKSCVGLYLTKPHLGTGLFISCSIHHILGFVSETEWTLEILRVNWII